jgi:hypothetical protein
MISFTRSRNGRSRRVSLRDERGVTLVMVMALLLVGTLMGAAGLAEALSSSGDAYRDTRVRRAQQAADAGVQTQLYQQDEASMGSGSYDFNGGPLSAGKLLDCTVPQLNAGLQVSGLVSVAANTAGVCPEAETSGGTSTTYSTPLGDHAYAQSEFYTNQTQLLGDSSEDELFPEIVSIGWDDNGQSAGANDVYAREKVILQPVGPLQAVEGMGDVTLNGLSALGLGVAVVVQGDVQALGKLTTPAVVTAVNLQSSSLVPTFAASSFVSTAQNVTSTPCVAGNPVTNCVIKRAPVSIAASKPDCPTTAACTALGSDYSGNTAGNTADTFSMSTGTVTFAAGDYVFCNFNATGGTINASSTGPVRIFIDSPTSARCAGNGYTQNGSGVWSGGNFNAANGINALLTGTVNGVANVVDPSGVQIYVAGDGSYDNNTTVNIGDTSSCTLKVLGVCTVGSTPPTQSMVIYAPTSATTVNTGVCLVGLLGSCTLGVAGAFAGSVVGDSVNITASTITQDLDLGNFPLYAGVNALQPVQYVQCGANNSSGSPVTSLTGVLATDTSGC